MSLIRWKQCSYIHRCWSRQILGVREILARIFPNIPEKFSGKSLCEYFLPHRSCTPAFEMTFKKRFSYDSAHVRCQFFKIKQRGAPVLSVFLGCLPGFSGILRTFLWILPIFSQILPGFSGNWPGFSTNHNFSGCACTSCPPPPMPLAISTSTA